MRLYLLFFSFIICMFAPVQADASAITADFTSGCSPLLVHFHPTDPACTGCTYSWDFGTGSPVGGYSASSGFYTVGPHTITLTVTSASGAITTSTIVVTVNPSPVATFTASDTTVCPGSAVTFINTSTPGVPGTMTTTWNFGDGNTGSGSPATNVYTTPGNYSVTLYVTNSLGCQTVVTKSGYIHVFTPPVANFSASSVSVCNPPGSITFSDGSSGAPPLSYSWSFGDGGTGTGADPVHTYTAGGSYTVKLVVTDANGCEDSITRTSYIYVGNLHASFTGTTSACVFSNVTFTNTSSTHTSQTWVYGDGGTSFGEDGFHAYSAPGTYNVKLYIFDGPCSDTVVHTIVITPGPSGGITISPTNPCPAPATISFTSTGPAGTGVTWSFGGVPGGSGSTTSHTYGTNGVETVTMVMTDPATGCKDTVTSTFTIYNLVLDAFATPTSGCKPLTVALTCSAFTTTPDGLTHTYPYPLSTYSWDFGDGSTGTTSASPSHTYTAVGTYTATVTVMTSNGCPATATVVIKVGSPPVVDFTATPTHVCYHNNSVITFTATVISGPVDDYVWNFGDATESDAVPTTTHIYIMPGVWTVTLTPYYHGCPGTPVIKVNYITVDSPKAIVENTYLCSPRTAVAFGDSSMGDDTHLWMFGDGSTSTIDNPVHTYPAIGPYVVKLATYNAHSGCRDTAIYPIDIVAPILDFTADNTHLCKYDSVHFTSSVTGGTASAYRWYINWGILPWAITSTMADEFYASGAYTITMTIKDNDACWDTLTKPNYVTVAKPVVNFTVAPTSGCWPLSVTVTDISTDVTGVPLSTYHWSFGDGTSAISTTASTTHVYTDVGTFTIADTAVDLYGCRDTAVHPSVVTVHRPNAAFTASTVHPCENVPVTFTCSGSGISSYSWTFGDGTTSTVASPSHTYTATGTYDVSLHVTDAFGCTNSATYPAYLNVTRPHAAFTVSDSISVCPPLNVHFTNASTGGVSNSWTMGDGGTSLLTSPTNLYTSAGLFNAMLVVTNTYGCKDTAQKPINIFGYAGSFVYPVTSGCSPLTVTFSASLTNVPNITWDFSDGNTSTVSSVDTISHIYVTPGAYVPKLILSDNTGCESSTLGIDTIKVDAVVANFSTHPNPVCIAEPFVFIDSSTSYFSTITAWDWAYDGHTSSISSPSYQIDTAGTYPVHLKVTDGWGCIGVADKGVIVWPLPVVTASRDTTVCVGDPATLYGYGASTYVWTADPTLACTSCNPAKATTTTITTYSVTGTDIHGCSDTASTTVRLRTLTIAQSWGDTAICYGIPTQIFDTGAFTYTWYPPTGLNNNLVYDPIATPPYTMTYTVVAKMGSCIPDTDHVTITVYPLPTVDAGPDQRLLAGETAQLRATGTLISTYAWAPANTLSCADCPDPVASMSVMTTYKVEVATIHGCLASDSVKILIYCDNSQVFVPNAFTPNGDGQNDVFYPRGIGVKVIKSFRIYNRWGELLFERENIDLNDATNAWDGSYKGSTPKPDVYVYIIDAVCFTGEQIFIKGDVTIIR